MDAGVAVPIPNIPVANFGSVSLEAETARRVIENLLLSRLAHNCGDPFSDRGHRASNQNARGRNRRMMHHRLHPPAPALPAADYLMMSDSPSSWQILRPRFVR